MKKQNKWKFKKRNEKGQNLGRTSTGQCCRVVTDTECAEVLWDVMEECTQGSSGVFFSVYSFTSALSQSIFCPAAAPNWSRSISALPSRGRWRHVILMFGPRCCFSCLMALCGSLKCGHNQDWKRWATRYFQNAEVVFAGWWCECHGKVSCAQPALQ